MGWLADLSSALGVPIGAGVAAAAFYRASVVAEREASKEALRDIARILRDPSWSRRSDRFNTVIANVFNATFGERQISWKCVRRSVYATIIFILALSMQYVFSTDVWIDLDEQFVCPENCWSTILFISSAPFADYFALWKTRIILRIISKYRITSVLWIVFDIVLSIFISFVVIQFFL